MDTGNSRRHRSLDDFNEITATSLEEANDASYYFNSHEQRSTCTIERSPLRSSSDRTQSARNYRSGDGKPVYTVSTDETAAEMMSLLRNGHIKPPAKRARSASAPHIQPMYTNELLDLLLMDDDDAINLSHDNDTVDVSQQSHVQVHDNNGNKSKGLLSSTVSTIEEYPFYSYIDYSREIDATPDVPLTAMGRVPTFPAKLHAILLRPELHAIVGWLPHGRSWKVHDPMEFEKQVIQMYFEFTKHPNSSFFRQAKLWGFLRCKQDGLNHDSYYHPKFIRGLPHLCKDLRRPPASHLPDLPAIDQEPDLTAISELYPVPPTSYAIRTDPTVRLDWFMKGKQQQQHQQQQPKKHDSSSSSAHDMCHPPRPHKEVMTKKTSSSTSTSTSVDCVSSTIVKRKRSTGSGSQPPIAFVDHHSEPYVELFDAYTPSNYDVHIDMNDDDEPIDDDLGLNLDPYFSKGYHLYPFYDYVDYSTTIDMFPFQPYTDIGVEPTLPVLLHAMLLSQQQQQVSNGIAPEPILRWQTHGRAWKICSMTKFETIMIPLFLENTLGPNNLTIGAFLRHVVRWGFKRLEQGRSTHSNDYDCYYHPKFLRGLPNLTKDWTMNDIPSTSSISTVQLTPDDENDRDEYPEPDFVKISQLHPVPEYNPNLTVDELLGMDWF
jgi:HSF-type DNA-binding